jgi:predicted transcriptional regulator
MKTATVRIEAHTQEKLRVLAEQSGESMQQVLGQAVEAYRRQRIIAETNAAYSAIRNDPKTWSEAQQERVAWDVTLADGLADD